MALGFYHLHPVILKLEMLEGLPEWAQPFLWPPFLTFLVVNPKTIDTPHKLAAQSLMWLNSAGHTPQ